MAPVPSAAKAGYPTAGSPKLECAQQCVRPCAFNGEFNLTSKITNTTSVVTLRNVQSPAPASYFDAKNPGAQKPPKFSVKPCKPSTPVHRRWTCLVGGQPCYEIQRSNKPAPPHASSAASGFAGLGVMARDDPRLDLPVHIDEEIEAVPPSTTPVHFRSTPLCTNTGKSDVFTL